MNIILKIFSIYFRVLFWKRKGVAILFKENVEYEVKQCNIDKNGRYIIMDVDIQGQRMLLVNVYAPCIDKPNDQVEFWNKMTSLILDFDNLDERLILCGGDINFLMNIGLDRSGGNPRQNEDVARAVQNFINTFDLVDIWRVRNPHLRQYTWRQKNPLIQSRLDLWFVPKLYARCG